MTSETEVSLTLLARQREEADDLLLAGICEMEALLKDLNLGLVLTVKVPFEGTLSYKKEANRWRFMFDNSEFSHAESNVPLINCARHIRVLAIREFPTLLAAARAALLTTRAAQAQALEALTTSKAFVKTLLSEK